MLLNIVTSNTYLGVSKRRTRKAINVLHKKVETVTYPLADNDCYIEESEEMFLRCAKLILLRGK